MANYIFLSNEDYNFKKIISILNDFNNDLEIIHVADFDLISKSEILNFYYKNGIKNKVWFLGDYYNENQVVDIDRLNIICSSLPYIYSFSDLVQSSSHYHKYAHNRFAEFPSPELDLKKSAAILQFLDERIDNSSTLIFYDQSLWERKLCYCYGVYKNIQIFTLSNSRFSNLLFWEKTINNSLEWYGVSSKSFLKYKFNGEVEAVSIDSISGIECIEFTDRDILLRRLDEVARNKNPITVLQLILRIITNSFKFYKATKWFFVFIIIKSGKFNKNYFFRDYFKFKRIFLFYFDKLRLYIKSLLNICQAIIYKKSSFVLSLTNYSIVALHYFPESSTLSDHGQYKNEIQNSFLIQSLNRNFEKLVYIDHPQMFLQGERPSKVANFFRQLPNTYYLKYFSLSGISLDFIKKANSVYTITGSIALEAALLDKNVFIFSISPLIWINNICLVQPSVKGYGLNAKQFHQSFSASNYVKIVKSLGFTFEKSLSALNKLM